MSSHSRPRLGVAVLIYDHIGRILLGKRSKSPNYGLWIIPGGGIELGESWKTAAVRELREETNLHLVLRDANPKHILEIINEDEHRVILVIEALMGVSPTYMHPSTAFVHGAPSAASDLLEIAFFTKTQLPLEEISPGIQPILSKIGWR